MYRGCEESVLTIIWLIWHLEPALLELLELTTGSSLIELIEGVGEMRLLGIRSRLSTDESGPLMIGGVNTGQKRGCT